MNPFPPLDEVATNPHAWLQRLHLALHPEKGPGLFTGYRMTAEEWEGVQGVLRTTPTLLFELHNACMGFSCGLAVYAEQPALYPGVDLPPTFLVDIDTHNIPIPQGRRPFEQGWDEFSVFSHTESNAHKIAGTRLEPLQEKGHYDY